MTTAQELAEAYRRLSVERWSYLSPFEFDQVTGVGGSNTEGAFVIILTDGTVFDVTVTQHEPEDDDD